MPGVHFAFRGGVESLFPNFLLVANVYEYPFSPHYLDLDGQRLHYVDEGQGPVVALLHGNPTWSYMYRRLIPVLAEQYRVIAPDHIGCGLSDKPSKYPYCLRQHRDNFLALLAHLDVKRYSLVAHDWGGAIGMAAAVTRPERLEKCVLMNTAAFPFPRLARRIAWCHAPIIGEFLVRRLNLFVLAARSMAVVRPMPLPARQALESPYDSWEHRVAIARFVEDIPMSPNHPSYQLLKEIGALLPGLRKKPMLLVWGGRDFCFDWRFLDEWRRRFPDAESHFLGEAGHYLLEDAADTAIPLITRFFFAGPEAAS
ncbi:MAG: alpha/beta fold hydrolase [Desulfobulbaceae bacterium]|nr:alpha/beta fold hydrolase [Desulfobulbaceae bacterium]